MPTTKQTRAGLAPKSPEASRRCAAAPGSEVLATCREAISGRLCGFDAGEVVKVDWDDGITCAIQRKPWKGSMVPIANCLAGVPRYLLRFDPQNVKGEPPDQLAQSVRKHDL